jgi:predicted SnoaL-like aldol condensation-catalyzing enzyme
MSNVIEEKNKALVLETIDTVFNKRDFEAAERYFSPKYIQHSTIVPPGRDGVFSLIKNSPPTKYETGIIVADGDFVIVHGRFSGIGSPGKMIAADIFRIKDEILVEHGCNSRRGHSGTVKERPSNVRGQISESFGRIN